jgi:hypothetical protein
MTYVEDLPEAIAELSAMMRDCDVSAVDDDTLAVLNRRIKQVKPKVQTFLNELAAKQLRLKYEMDLRKSVELVAKDHPDFVCPISYALMRDPVLAPDGHSYERQKIEEWFGRGNTVSPMTNAEMTNTTLIPNITFKKAIERALGVELAAGASGIVP